MRLDGKDLANQYLAKLKINIEELKKQRGVSPRMTVILVGDDPASESYVKQKELAALFIGAKLRVKRMKSEANFSQIVPLIQKARENKLVHGILIQLPLPSQLESQSLIELIPANKDIDGLKEKNTFQNPTAKAVFYVLSNIYCRENQIASLGVKLPAYKRLADLSLRQQGFLNWLKKKEIVLLGTGATGGQPIARSFSRRKINLLVCDSKTPSVKRLLRRADIVISAIGSANIVKTRMLKKGVIAIGVGIARQEKKNGKTALTGDFEENGLEKKASFYTPTPGGLGPLTVAALMENLVLAARRLSRH